MRVRLASISIKSHGSVCLQRHCASIRDNRQRESERHSSREAFTARGKTKIALFNLDFAVARVLARISWFVPESGVCAEFGVVVGCVLCPQLQDRVERIERL